MKHFFAIFLLAFSSSSFALGGYSSIESGQQKILNTIQNDLGFKDDDSNSVKLEIYNNISWAFSDGWQARWFDLTELASSKIKNPSKTGFIELAVNSKDQGLGFFTFIYKPNVKQITLISKQIRHGSKSLALNKYQEDKKTRLVDYENDSTALLHKKGYVDYEFFNVLGDTASLTFYSVSVIDVK